MKKILSLCAVVFISGCLNSPPSQKPQKTNYTFQCLYLTLPENVVREVFFNSLTLLDDSANLARLIATQAQIENALKNKEASIVDLSASVAIGESSTNDQTGATSLPIDLSIINEEVVTEYETFNIGQLFAVTLNEVDENVFTSHIHLETKELRGFDEFEVKSGVKARTAIIEWVERGGELTLEPNVWTFLLGTTNQQSDETVLSSFFCIRVLPTTTN